MTENSNNGDINQFKMMPVNNLLDTKDYEIEVKVNRVIEALILTNKNIPDMAKYYDAQTIDRKIASIEASGVDLSDITQKVESAFGAASEAEAIALRSNITSEEVRKEMANVYNKVEVRELITQAITGGDGTVNVIRDDLDNLTSIVDGINQSNTSNTETINSHTDLISRNSDGINNINRTLSNDYPNNRTFNRLTDSVNVLSNDVQNNARSINDTKALISGNSRTIGALNIQVANHQDLINTKISNEILYNMRDTLNNSIDGVNNQVEINKRNIDKYQHEAIRIDDKLKNVYSKNEINTMNSNLDDKITALNDKTEQMKTDLDESGDILNAVSNITLNTTNISNLNDKVDLQSERIDNYTTEMDKRYSNTVIDEKISQFNDLDDKITNNKNNIVINTNEISRISTNVSDIQNTIGGSNSSLFDTLFKSNTTDELSTSGSPEMTANLLKKINTIYSEVVDNTSTKVRGLISYIKDKVDVLYNKLVGLETTTSSMSSNINTINTNVTDIENYSSTIYSRVNSLYSAYTNGELGGGSGGGGDTLGASEVIARYQYSSSGVSGNISVSHAMLNHREYYIRLDDTVYTTDYINNRLTLSSYGTNSITVVNTTGGGKQLEFTIVSTPIRCKNASATYRSIDGSSTWGWTPEWFGYGFTAATKNRMFFGQINSFSSSTQIQGVCLYDWNTSQYALEIAYYNSGYNYLSMQMFEI